MGHERLPRFFPFVVALVVACCAVLGDADGAVAAEMPVTATTTAEAEVTRPDTSSSTRLGVAAVHPSIPAGHRAAPVGTDSTRAITLDAPAIDDALGLFGDAHARRGPPQD